MKINPIFSLDLDNLDGEEWVDALGFDGLYQVSNQGRVKTLGRWVSNGKSERWIKERIRKLYVGKDDRITMIFNINMIATSVNLPALIYFSFNPKESYKDSTYCVCHKNKIQYDNRLSNLCLIKKSDSHTINFEKGLLPHLKANNDKIKAEYDKLTEKTCTVCQIPKDIKQFEHGRNTCKSCRAIQKSKNYYSKKS